MTESEIRLAQLAQSIGRARRIASGAAVTEEPAGYPSLAADFSQTKSAAVS